MGFNVTCWPGPNAAAGFTRVIPHLPALVLYLDPVNLAIQLPPFPDGDRHLAKFCRELAREANRLADDVDPDGETSPDEYGPRHLLITDDAGDLGSGL